MAAAEGLPASIFTRVKLAPLSNAAPLRRAGGWPVVLFSTGYGVERQLCTGLVQDLASHGYVVAAIDHPHDAGIVSFPDGHTVSIGKVGESPSAISNALDLDHVGMLGHSLGGATAAATMLVDRSLDAGLDMDGLLFGNVAVTGVEKPFMLFSADPGFRHKPNLAESGAISEDSATRPTSQAPPTSHSATSCFWCPSWPVCAKRPRRLAFDLWSAPSIQWSRSQPSGRTSWRSSTAR